MKDLAVQGTIVGSPTYPAPKSPTDLIFYVILRLRSNVVVVLLDCYNIEPFTKVQIHIIDRQLPRMGLVTLNPKPQTLNPKPTRNTKP